MTKVKKGVKVASKSSQERLPCVKLNKNLNHLQIHEEIVFAIKNKMDCKICDKKGVLEKFESFDCAAALTWLYIWKHEKRLTLVEVKQEQNSNYIPQESDYYQKSGWDYLKDAMSGSWNERTIQKANKILSLNGVIAYFSAKTEEGRINVIRFFPEKLQYFLDKPIRNHCINTHGKCTNTFCTCCTNTVTECTNTVTECTNTVTNCISTHISIILKDELKDELKDVCIDTPKKNQFLKTNQKNDSPQNNPISQFEKKPIVNLVNYNSAEAFASEFSDYLMDNRKAIKEGVKEFDYAKISSYSEKHTSIVFGGKYEGLKSYQSYAAHCEKMIDMGIVGEINTKQPAAAKNGNLRGEGQLSIDMKNGTLERSVEANLKLWKNDHRDLDLEGF